LSIISSVLAHTGHELINELHERKRWLDTQPRSVKSCNNELERRGLLSNAIERRRDLFYRNSQDSLTARQLPNNFAFPPNPSDERLLFTDNSSCVLTPEVDGLGHFIAGETIRSDISEGQPGVPLTLEIQIVDVHNCQPLPGVFVEVYQCNATGVYSGVQAQGNGNANDASNLKATHGRGIQQTDHDGVVTFKSIFPGHYYGVATHIHVLTHSSAQPVAPSGEGKNYVQATHNGRIFFDQDLIHQVEGTSPYNTNQQPLTLNSEDVVLNQEAKVTDPLARYVYMGQRPEDGVLAWISVGIDPTVVHPM
ncbi:hypothetical protein CERZMDRAFT_12997, partial [Cercospora zeae-maydis SCOH1-5]